MDHGVINSQSHMMVCRFIQFYMMLYVVSVPGIVNFIAQLETTNINVTLQVRVVGIHSDCWIFSLFQPPPLIAGFPVLHYVVSYNTSDNSIEVQAKLSPSHNSYTVSGVPGVTYYITVFAVNALGPGPISEYTTVNGEKNINNCIMSLFIIFSVTAASYNYFNTSLN